MGKPIAIRVQACAIWITWFTIEKANRVHIAGTPLHDVTRLHLVVPHHGDVLQMCKETIAKRASDRFAGDAGKSALQTHKCGSGCCEGGHDDGNQS